MSALTNIRPGWHQNHNDLKLGMPVRPRGINPEQLAARETVAQFLARGGKITVLASGEMRRKPA